MEHTFGLSPSASVEVTSSLLLASVMVAQGGATCHSVELTTGSVTSIFLQSICEDKCNRNVCFFQDVQDSDPRTLSKKEGFREILLPLKDSSLLWWRVFTAPFTNSTENNDDE